MVLRHPNPTRFRVQLIDLSAVVPDELPADKRPQTGGKSAPLLSKLGTCARYASSLRNETEIKTFASSFRERPTIGIRGVRPIIPISHWTVGRITAALDHSRTPDFAVSRHGPNGTIGNP